jgi:hypothetical protein
MGIKAFCILKFFKRFRVINAAETGNYVIAAAGSSFTVNL